MANLLTNIAQTCADLTNIKNAIQDKGVDIASGTPSSEYSSKIDEVYEAGKQELLELHPEVTVGGNYISVDDVSELPHSVACKVESANLLKYPYYRTTETINGVTFTDNGDGTVTINGTATAWTNYYLRFTGDNKRDEIKAGIYTLSGIDSSSEGIYFYVFVFPEQTGTGSSVSISVAGKTQTITVENDAYFGCYLSVPPQRNFNNATVKPMLNRGTTALPYTPYVNPEEVKVTRCGKNLCPINDRTFTTSTWKEFNPPLPAGRYTMSGKFATEHPDNQAMVLFQNADRANATNMHLIFDIPDNGEYSSSFIAYEPISWIFWYAANGYANSMDYKASIANFQLNEGKTALPYEPYNGQTLTPSADGKVEGMTSVSPYMNIFTNTEGANLEVTYRKSTGLERGKQAEREEFWNDFFSQAVEGYCIGLFSGSGWNAETFSRLIYPNKKITPTGTTGSERMFYMFNRNKAVTSTPNPPIDMTEFCNHVDFSQVTALNWTFQNARIKNVTVDASMCKSLNATFNMDNGGSIDYITLKVTEVTTSFALCFAYAYDLKNITFTDDSVIVASINFQHSPLTKASIESVVAALSPTVTGQTVTFKKTAKEAAFAQEEWEALIATKSNWTFSLV